jgi:hypothetical protein
MNENGRHGANDAAPPSSQPTTDPDSTLLPMLICGLVLIVVGMIFVMWLT